MKVYAVIGGVYYQGESFYSLKLFDCKSSASERISAVFLVNGYDYAKMEDREVNMESAIKL